MYKPFIYLSLLCCVVSCDVIAKSSSVKTQKKALKADHNVKAVASVGLNLITDVDVKERTNLLLAFSNKKLGSDADRVLREYVKKGLVDEQIKVVYAKKFAPPPLKEWATMNDVAERFAMIAEGNGKKPADFIKFISGFGVNVKTFYDQIYSRLTWDAYIYAKYGEKISFSDKDVENKWRSVCNMLKKKAYAVERFFAPFSNDSEKVEAKKLINAVLEMTRAGVDFQSVARQFSSGNEAISGGDLGFIADGGLPFSKENEALKSMKRGEMRVIEMNNSFSILKVNTIISAADENGELITVRYIVLPFSENPTQEEVQGKLAKLNEISSSAKDVNDMIKKATEANIQITPPMDLHSGHIDKQLKEILDKANNGISQVICSQSEALCACIFRRKKISIKLPTKEDIKEKMISDKLNTMSAYEMHIAKKTVNVEIKD